MPVLMTEAAMGSDAFGRLYPDVVAAGGLAKALQSALVGAGSSLIATGHERMLAAPVYARVEAGKRFSQVYVAAEERLFLFDFWNRGVMLATGRTADLHEMARAIARWVGSECLTADLARECGCVRVQAEAASYERGEEVEQRWREYLASLHAPFPELKDFVLAAAAHPKLRELFPYTSLNRFCFSRCTGYPFTRDTPYVWPVGPHEYEVLSPVGMTLGRGTAEECVRLVVAALPPDCGPALPGTAEEMEQG